MPTCLCAAGRPQPRPDLAMAWRSSALTDQSCAAVARDRSYHQGNRRSSALRDFLRRAEAWRSRERAWWGRLLTIELMFARMACIGQGPLSPDFIGAGVAALWA